MVLCVFFSVTPGISPRESFSFSNRITFFGMLDMFTVYIRVIMRNIINKVLFKNFKTGHPISRVTSLNINMLSSSCSYLNIIQIEMSNIIAIMSMVRISGSDLRKIRKYFVFLFYHHHHHK